MDSKKLGLSQAEIRSAMGETKYGLHVEEVSRLFGIPVKTLYEWKAKGYLDGTYRKRGKYLLFWPNRIIDRIFNGPEWH
jgi:hypothetical protein